MHRSVPMRLLPAFALAFIVGCSGSAPDALDPAAGSAPSGASTVTTPPAGTTTTPPGGGTTSPKPGTDAGAPGKDGGTKPPSGSGGGGGPGAGEHDISFQGASVALHVPAATGTPMPLMIILHGQGDTGRNFLNVWLARGYPQNLIIAAPDDNTDDTSVALEQSLRSMFNVDVAREYLFGFSQGGAYAAFVLFDGSAASRYAGVTLASSGLAADPSGIPAASAGSPAVAVVIDPTDPNNTWNQGRHVMEDFVTMMSGRGYDAKLFLHNAGHTISTPEVKNAIDWMLTKTK